MVSLRRGGRATPASAYRWAVLIAATAAQASASFALLGLAALAGFLPLFVRLSQAFAN